MNVQFQLIEEKNFSVKIIDVFTLGYMIFGQILQKTCEHVQNSTKFAVVVSENNKVVVRFIKY